MKFSTSSRYNNYNSCGTRDMSRPVIINGCGEQQLTDTNIRCKREKGMEDYLMMYVYRGYGHYLINGETEKISEGHIVIYKPKEGQQIKYLYTEQPHIFWVHFTGYDIENLLKESGIIHKKIIYVGVSEEITNLYKKVLYSLKTKNNFYEYTTRTALMYLFSIIAESINNVRDFKKVPDKFNKVIDFMHTNFHEDFSNRYLASICNLSEYHFIHEFKKRTGMPPKAYICQVRINKAKELLFMTDLNINEIANIIGYHNPLYFSRIFKLHCNLSPSEYRIKQQSSFN